MKRDVTLAPLIPYWEVDCGKAWQDRRGVLSPIEVEIGFGLGEVLVDKARRHPQRHFCGIEENWERTWRTLKALTKRDAVGQPVVGMENVSIFFCDARIVFDRFFTSRNIDHVYCLFPCPWPKTSHEKHRLFQRPFLEVLNNRLVDGGTVQIVTDHQPYHEWIAEQVQGCGFERLSGVLTPQFQTKFEKKWQSRGQEQFFETRLTKREHHELPSAKDEVLKSFRLSHFDPHTFFPQPYRDEDCTVVCKDVMYDERRQVTVVLVVVAEGELAQHFRIVIFRREDYWRVCKCDGQTFLPTPGINQAIEHVYQSALAAITL